MDVNPPLLKSKQSDRCLPIQRQQRNGLWRTSSCRPSFCFRHKCSGSHLLDFCSRPTILVCMTPIPQPNRCEHAWLQERMRFKGEHQAAFLRLVCGVVRLPFRSYAFTRDSQPDHTGPCYDHQPRRNRMSVCPQLRILNESFAAQCVIGGSLVTAPRSA